MEKKSRVTKKNTLLYLDESLVEMAKEKNFNISELAEEAIRTKLNINGYNKRFDPSDYLENLRKKGLAYYIPFRINNIKIENYKFVKKVDIDFKQKNLIVGVNGAGKTRIVRSILLFFDNSHSLKDFSKEECPQGPGEIKISFDQTDLLCCEVCGERISMDKGCILIDEGLGRLDSDSGIVFLKYLLERNEQIIITSVSSERYTTEPLVKEFNIIKIEYDPSQDLRQKEIVLINEIAHMEKKLEMLTVKLQANKKRQSKSEEEGMKNEEIEKIEVQIMEIMNDIHAVKERLMSNRNNLEEVRNQIVSKMHGDE